MSNPLDKYRHAPQGSPEHNAAIVLIAANLTLDMLRLTAVLPPDGRADILEQIADMRELAEAIPVEGAI